LGRCYNQQDVVGTYGFSTQKQLILLKKLEEGSFAALSPSGAPRVVARLRFFLSAVSSIGDCQTNHLSQCHCSLQTTIFAAFEGDDEARLDEESRLAFSACRLIRDTIIDILEVTSRGFGVGLFVSECTFELRPIDVAAVVTGLVALRVQFKRQAFRQTLLRTRASDVGAPDVTALEDLSWLSQLGSVG